MPDPMPSERCVEQRQFVTPTTGGDRAAREELPVEGSQAPLAGDGGTKSKTEDKPKGSKEPTMYVVLVRWEPEEWEDGDGEFYEVLTGEDGTPLVCEAHRREDVLADLINENLLDVEDDGRTPYVAIIPARSFKPARALVERKPTIKFD